MAHIRLKRHYGTSQKALQVIFKSSQTYTIESKWKSCDVFLVGGGAGGGGGCNSNTGYKSSPNGGGSGKTLTNKLVSITSNSVVITIGAGGVGGLGREGGALGSDTSIEINGNTITAKGYQGTFGSGAGNQGYTSVKGTDWIRGGNGGSDGSDGILGASSGSPGTWAVGKGQGTTTRAFEESTETLYAGAGGGGGYNNYNNSTGDSANVPGGAGGAGGGGAGGTKVGFTITWNGTPGGANTGGGGGGGYWSQSNESSWTPTNYRGGNGGSGVAIIRLYKNNNRPTDIDWSKCTIVLD